MAEHGATFFANILCTNGASQVLYATPPGVVMVDATPPVCNAGDGRALGELGGAYIDAQADNTSFLASRFAGLDQETGVGRRNVLVDTPGVHVPNTTLNLTHTGLPPAEFTGGPRYCTATRPASALTRNGVHVPGGACPSTGVIVDQTPPDAARSTSSTSTPMPRWRRR